MKKNVMTRAKRFAPVMPIQLMEQLFGGALATRELLGSYHLLLAHDVVRSVESRKRWTALVNSMRTLWGNTNIIVDTSVIELGQSEDWPLIMSAAATVDANVVVLPDVIGDVSATLEHINALLEHDRLDPNYDYMFVPQGKTLEEYIHCINYVAGVPSIGWLGIPRDALQFIASRTLLVTAAQIICPEKKIHLLGFSDNLLDDFATLRMRGVYGIDSAVPARAGQIGLKFSLDNSDYGKRAPEYWESESLTSMALYNLRVCQQYAKNCNA